MTAYELPMFPLGTVLAPGSLLPLQVFEPRYRALVEDCVAASRDFGVVLIARGHEVGGGDQRHDVGTTAQLVQVGRMDDGRFALLCIGTTRFRVREWLADAPYPRALVEDFPDAEDFREPNRWWSDVGEPTVRLADLVSRVRRLTALALELGDHVPDPSGALADSPIRCSYDLAQLAPLSASDQFRLLALAGPVERMDAIAALLDDLEAILRLRLADEGSSSETPDAW